MGRVKVFDDLLSWVHFFYSMVLAALSPIALVASSIVYVAYQHYEREKWEYKRGDFLEWLCGIIVGVIVRWLAQSLLG